MPADNKNIRKYKKTPLKKHILFLLEMTAGSFISIGAFLIFIGGNDLLSGGVFGIAQIFNHYITAVPLGVFYMLLNVPLLVMGWRQLRPRFACYTIYVVALQSFLTEYLVPYLPQYTNDLLLACIFGGLLGGVGNAIVVRAHGSGGGTDIVAIIARKHFDISIGTISLMANAVVVCLAGMIFGFERAMYTMVSMYASSQAFNKVLGGFNPRRNAMIVCDNGQELADRLMRALGRGVTLLPGEGAFSHQKKDVLICVMSRMELPTMKEIVQEVSPNAFVFINETYEVQGRFYSTSSQKIRALAAAQQGVAFEEDFDEDDE